MIAESTKHHGGQDIIILGPYRPWSYHKQMGGTNADWPLHSERVFDVKKERPAGFKYFLDYMAPRLSNFEAVAAVPSHDPEKGAGGIQKLATKLADECGLIDASGVLVRHTKIAKLATGGDRSLAVHLSSVHLPDASSIAGKAVLLIDDVMTGGNSLLACSQILLGAGAAKVKCLALGYTTH